MKTEKSSLNQYWAGLIIEELIRHGIAYFCIGPGSRSTPLVVAAARHGGVQTFIGYDERSLGFHALGYARATNCPAAVIATSGTAVANLYPAVVEAFSDGVPMIVLTADRPPELIDTGANQTIRQDRFFGTYVTWYADLPCPDYHISPAMVLTTVDQAVYRSKVQYPGPVHLNCRFREPLEPSETQIPAEYLSQIQTWENGNHPFTSYSTPKQTLSEDDVQTLTELIQNTERGMIIVGDLRSQTQKEAVLELARKTQWTTYADISSGLRFSSLPLHLIRFYDQQLLSGQFSESVKPSVVLHFGGHVTSKRIWQYFDQNRPQRYIIIKETPTRYDPAHYVTDHLQTDIADVCQKLADRINGRQSNSFVDSFNDKTLQVNTVLEETIQGSVTLTEPFVSRTISDIIPESSCLFLSNSMPVRDMDLYAKTIDKPILVGTNRGVSGIDGILSTATGFAAGHRKTLTLVIGDVAMLHDLNALSLLHKIKIPIVIVVINNRGGGIFDFLPISQYTDVFEPYFVMPHEFNLKGACETFKVPYFSADKKETFAEQYQTAITRNITILIEVFTDRQDNLKLRKQMKSRILQVLQEDIC